jgi:hypothetical protein
MSGSAAVGDKIRIVGTGERGFVCGFYPAAVRIVRVFLESGVFLELDRSQLERDER